MLHQLPSAVTGQRRFLADSLGPDTLHAGFVRSPEAHASIRGVALEEARSMPGIVAAYGADDLGAPDVPARLRPTAPPCTGMDRPLLARHRVRYVGEPMAMVVAESPEELEDALFAVDVDLEPLPAVIDPHLAIGDEVLLFPEGGTNVVHDRREEAADGETAWPVRIATEVTSQRLSAVTLEPMGILATTTAEGRLEVWCGHQAPHRLKRQLAALLDLDPASIRVRVPYVGGAFGLKGSLFTEYLAVIVAARRLGRPVVWLQARREQLASANHGRGHSVRVELEGERDGTIRRARVHVLGDLGAYPQNGFLVPESTALMVTGAYDIPQVEVSLQSVVTTMAPTGPYRGAGRPEATLAIERAVDVFAREAGLDPVAVRERNLIFADRMPYRTTTGALYDGGDYRRVLRLAVDRIGHSRIRAEQADRLARQRDPVGVGVAVYVERAGGPINGAEYARVEVRPDGTAVVATGSTPAGQDHDRVWRRVVADVLTIEPDRVTVVAGDTDVVADGEGTFGSRSTQTGAVAAWRTATALVDRLREVAAAALEAAPDDLRLADGKFSVAGVPGAEVTLAAAAARALASGIEPACEEMYRPGVHTFPYGAHAAEVEVSLETGEVTLRRMVVIDDCGRVLDPMLVEAQVRGALAQGIGAALLEGIRYDDEGQLLTASLSDYLVPRATDIPEIVTGHTETPAPNPLGVKGVGEAGCIGAPAAILNAVADALFPYGVTDLSLPLTQRRVWEALQTAGRARARKAVSPPEAGGI